MRHLLTRRPIALLALTALLSSGGISSGLLTGLAQAATDQPLQVGPQFVGNTDSGANNVTLTFTSPGGQDFDSNGANEKVTLQRISGGPTDILPQLGQPTSVASTSPSTAGRFLSLQARFDLRQQPPGQYSATVADTNTRPGPTGAKFTYSCGACFTVNGFKPTVTGIARDPQVAPPTPASSYIVSGTDFALGAVVTFPLSGAGGTDTGVTFSYTPAPASASSPNPTANAIKGSLDITPTALGGAHDVVVTNTDGKSGVCVGCLSIPTSGAVYRADQPSGTQARLGQGASADLIVSGAGFTPSTTANLSTATNPGENVAKITVGSVTLLDAQTLKLHVSVSDTSGDNTPDTAVSRPYTLALSGPGGISTTVPNAVYVSPRPTINNSTTAGRPSEQNPGVNSTNVPIKITGTFLQPGATASFVPSTGITVNSFTVAAGGASGTVTVSIAANAPLTSRDLVVTNPDLGVDTGDCTGCITPVAAPVLNSSNPLSRSAGTAMFTLTLPGSNISQDNPALRSITIVDANIVVGTTVSDNARVLGLVAPTQVSVDVTVPAGTSPGAKQVFYKDGNGAVSKCTTPSGGECFTVDNLIVNAVSPNFGTNDGPATITVTGSGFDIAPTAAPTVLLQRGGEPDIVATSVTVLSATSLTATVNLAAASPVTNGWDVRVTNSPTSTGVLRGGFTIVGNTPTLSLITPVSPNGAPASSQKLVTVTGTNFARGGSLAFAPDTTTANTITTVSSTFLNTTSYQFLLNIPAGAPVGPRNMTFANSDAKSAGCNACFTVTAPPGTPTVTPASRAPGSATFAMTVNDTSTGATAFNGTPVVTFNGTGVTAGAATGVTPKSFTVQVTVAPDATLSKRNVTITNGDGGVSNCTNCFTVVSPPKITAISPASLARGSSNTPVTVTGTGFGNAPALDLGPGVTASATTPSADGTSLTAIVSVTAGALPRGLRDVSLTNTDSANGGKGTLAAALGIGDVPGAPTLSTPTRADRAVALTWAAPADNGGLPILSYTVTVTKTADGTAVTPTFAYSDMGALVSGLTNGTSYTFKVKATNAVGTGPDSAPKLGIPAKAPDAPTGVSASAGDATATVTWIAPSGAGNGGDPVTSYTVTASPQGGTVTYPADRTLTSASFTGLANGTTYTFSVVATNTVGTSSPSAASNAVTPTSAPPNVPSNLVASVTRAAGTVDLTWTAPAAPPSPTTSYTVTVSPSGGSIAYPGNRTTTGATVTGLTNGTLYSFTVAANSTSGTSPASNTANATPYDVPGVVRNLTGTVTSGTGSVSWDAPTSNGGSAITKYTLTVTPADGTVVYPADRTQTGATITGLSSGTSYSVSVVAENLRGPGAATTFGPLAPPGPPTAPRAVTATAGNGQATVAWTAPSSDNGSAVTAYTVKSSPGGFTKTVGNVLTASVTGLTNGTAYTFTVVATNKNGDSPASAASNAVTPSAAGLYHALPPTRLLDTREGSGALVAGTDRVIAVGGRAGVPSNASAVVLNLTATRGSAHGNLAVYPTGHKPANRTSNLNYEISQSIAVQVQTGLGTNGAVSIAVNTGTVHVVIDVLGWYGSASDTTGAGYQPLSPRRVLDTRTTSQLVAGSDQTLQLGGTAGVPANATAVALNVTGTGASGGLNIGLYPSGGTPGTTSTVNLVRGQTIANAAVATLGPDGKIRLRVNAGRVNVLVDVVGYYGAGATGRFLPLTPARLLDTRVNGGRVGPSADKVLQVSGRGGVPTGAVAGVLSVTGTGATQPLYVQVFPTGNAPAQRTSTLNLIPRRDIANLAIASLASDGSSTLHVSDPDTYLVVDVFGYFLAS